MRDVELATVHRPPFHIIVFFIYTCFNHKLNTQTSIVIPGVNITEQFAKLT